MNKIETTFDILIRKGSVIPNLHADDTPLSMDIDLPRGSIIDIEQSTLSIDQMSGYGTWITKRVDPRILKVLLNISNWEHVNGRVVFETGVLFESTKLKYPLAISNLPANDIRAVYLGLYAQSEHSELLKSKFNPYYASRKPVPASLKEAVLNGFLWGENNEDAIFWHKYYESL